MTLANGNDHNLVVSAGCKDELIRDGVVLWQGIVWCSRTYNFHIEEEPALLTIGATSNPTYRLQVSSRLVR